MKNAKYKFLHPVGMKMHFNCATDTKLRRCAWKRFSRRGKLSIAAQFGNFALVAGMTAVKTRILIRQRASCCQKSVHLRKKERKRNKLNKSREAKLHQSSNRHKVCSFSTFPKVLRFCDFSFNDRTDGLSTHKHLTSVEKCIETRRCGYLWLPSPSTRMGLKINVFYETDSSEHQNLSAERDFRVADSETCGIGKQEWIFVDYSFVARENSILMHARTCEGRIKAFISRKFCLLLVSIKI